MASRGGGRRRGQQGGRRQGKPRQREPGPPVEIVSSSAKCREIVRGLLSAGDPVAMDAEGIRLGPNGPLTLLQIGTWGGQVYLFDVQENEDLIHGGGLKQLLESTQLLKVVHSCHGDSGALYFQHGVKLQNMFDVQAANLVIETHVHGDPFPVFLKLEDLVTKYGGTPSPAKALQQSWKYREDYWARRPLTQDMIDYAAGDVTVLIPTVYCEMQRIIDEYQLSDDLAVYVDEIIHEYLEPERVREQRAKRKEEAVVLTLGQLDKKWRHRQPALSSLTETEETALWSLTKVDVPISPMLRGLRDALVKSFLAQEGKALRQDPEKFLKELSELRYIETRIGNLAKHGDEMHQQLAQDLLIQIDVAKVNRAIKKISKRNKLGSREKFLLMKIDEDEVSDIDALDRARYFVAGQLEETIAQTLRGDPNRTEHLHKTDRDLLCTTPERYLRNHIVRQAREILLEKKRSEASEGE